MQVYYYFNRYKEDSAWIKLLVFLVWGLDTLHQGLITHTAYTYLVTEYGNLLFLGTIVKSLLIEVIVSGLVVLFVQSFFVLRVWKCEYSYLQFMLLHWVRSLCGTVGVCEAPASEHCIAVLCALPV